MRTVKTSTRERYLSPKEYVKELQINQVHNNIEQVKFIPPQIGKGGFGKFLVKYKMPVLV